MLKKRKARLSLLLGLLAGWSLAAPTAADALEKVGSCTSEGRELVGRVHYRAAGPGVYEVYQFGYRIYGDASRRENDVWIWVVGPNGRRYTYHRGDVVSDGRLYRVFINTPVRVASSGYTEFEAIIDNPLGPDSRCSFVLRF
jgi:hypothetical protein